MSFSQSIELLNLLLLAKIGKKIVDGREPQLDENNMVVRDKPDPNTFYLAYDFVEKHFYAIGFITRFLFERVEARYRYCYWCYRRHVPHNFDGHTCQGLNIKHYQCDICTNLFFDKQVYDNHLALESEGWNCDCCGKNTFRGNDCYELHTTTNCHAPQDSTKIRCEHCGFPHLRSVPHECKDYYSCQHCEAKFKSFMDLIYHVCYFTNDKQKRKSGDNYVETRKMQKSKKGKYFIPQWFYDFETCREVEQNQSGKYKHKVMAWAMKLLCLPSMNDEKWQDQYNEMLDLIELQLTNCNLPITYRKEESDHPGLMTFMITGKTLDVFMNLVFRHLNIKEMQPTLWAHNGSKFDGKFVLDYILNQWNYDLAGDCYTFEQRLAPQKVTEKNSSIVRYEWKRANNYFKTGNVCQVSMIGSKALSIKASNVTFRCSYAHLAAPLAKLPKMFGFKNTLRKGEFPYGRLKEDAWGSRHVDGLPPLIEYSPDTKKPDDRKKLILWWYEEQQRRNASNSINSQVQQFLPDLECNYQYDPQKFTTAWEFDEELWSYLLTDVEVGARALYSYHTTALEMQKELSQDGESLSPLIYATSPAWAKDMWQLFFMPKNQVALLKKDDAAFIRSSLHGGRTDKRATIISLSDEAFNNGDRIHYYDFKSLYPSVQKCSVHDTYFPLGTADDDLFLVRHPNLSNQVILDHMKDKTGFLKVDTKHLKFVTHPTLCRMKAISGSEKLMFTNEDTQGEIYCWPELEEAILSGEVQVTKVYKAVVFRRTTDTFNGYVDFFFKVKEQAEKNGNEGLRSLAKLLLNSLWGKLGQNSYPIREWVRSVERERYLQQQFEKGTYEFISCIPKGNRMNHYCYRIKNDFNNLGSTAVHIAAHVSTWGRVMLHRKVLRIHGQRAVYCDTDSAIIYLRQGDEMPFVGDNLGDLTNEVPKILKDAGLAFTGEAFIREAVLVAPKTYALHIQTTCGVNYYKVVCKGFEPSYQNSKAFHFENFKKLILDKRRRRVASDEEPPMRFIVGAPSLRFESSLTRNEITPIEMYATKKLTGNYDKGIQHPMDDRLIIPYGSFVPQSSFLFDLKDGLHYE